MKYQKSSSPRPPKQLITSLWGVFVGVRQEEERADEQPGAAAEDIGACRRTDRNPGTATGEPNREPRDDADGENEQEAVRDCEIQQGDRGADRRGDCWNARFAVAEGSQREDGGGEADRAAEHPHDRSAAEVGKAQ
jgi:hypothetical protein